MNVTVPGHAGRAWSRSSLRRCSSGNDGVFAPDTRPRDQVEAEADRAERLEERGHALEGRAARRAGEARARFDAAYATMDLIPVGQPILVGQAITPSAAIAATWSA